MEDFVVFEVGDWVDWAFKPNDPNGPYARLLPGNRMKNGNHGLNGDPINDRLIRYEPPPYHVVEVFIPSEVRDEKTKEGSIAASRYHDRISTAGHPQLVRVVMYQKPNHGGPKEKIRGFPGMLFRKVPPPNGIK